MATVVKRAAPAPTNRKSAASEEPISLTQPAFEAVLLLEKLGALQGPVELDSEFDRNPLVELKRKEVVKNVGGSRGRPGKIQLLVPTSDLTVSRRRRENGAKVVPSVNGTSQNFVKPTVEDMLLLLAKIQEAEVSLNMQASSDAQRRISSLKRALATAEGSEERRVFRELSAEMDRFENLSAEIRQQAFKEVEASRSPVARFLSLLSRDRSNQN